MFPRLLVGHTHADIDAKFGTIWTKIRNQHVLTPQRYASLIASALESKANYYEVSVKDIFVIPDYKTLLEPHIDKHFSK